MTAFLDDAVGNVSAALRATGLEDNTIVVFVSDNGGPTALNGAQGLWLQTDSFVLCGLVLAPVHRGHMELQLPIARRQEHVRARILS